MRSLLFNYENQARDSLSINWDEVYLYFLTMQPCEPIFLARTDSSTDKETPPPDIFRVPLPLRASFCAPGGSPDVTQAPDRAKDLGNEDPAANHRSFVNFPDP